MNESNSIERVSQAIAGAPVMTNVMPLDGDIIQDFIKVLHAEGFPALEILARPFDQAAALLEKLNDSPERDLLYVGLGTIKTEAEARAAARLKPDFLVAPTFSRRVLDIAVEMGVPYVPGVSTLQDIQNVMEAFAEVGREMTVLKACPVNMIDYECLRIMGAIYSGVTFCITGTVTMASLATWKEIPCAGPAMESSFVPEAMLRARDWDVVRERLQEIKTLCQ